MSEGSIVPDGDAVEESEETEVEESEAEETQPEETEATPETTEETEETKPPLTEEGTKLDPNPLSAAHQQLANAERKLKAYETVLNDPNLYQEFAGKLAGKPQVQEITPDSIQTVEDLVQVVNDLRKQASAVEEQNRALQGQLGQMTTKQFADNVEKNISQGTKLVQDTYPELRSGDPSYNEHLEKQVSALYHELNYDPQLEQQTGGEVRYTDRYPLHRVAKTIMDTYNLTKQSASQEAQTVVKQKSMGKVVTSGKPSQSEPDYSELSIAQRIALANKRKK